MVSRVIPTDLPAPLRWAVWLLAVEAAGGGVLAAILLYQGFAAEPTDRGNALALAGFAAVLAAVLAGLALALSRRKPRARAPAIVLQLLAVMLAYLLVTEGLVGVGLPIAVLGIVVVTLLLAPSTNALLQEPR